MKKTFLLIATIILSLIFITFSDASYIIHLKNGKQFLTSSYWEEGSMINFYISGGVIGIEKDAVIQIEESSEIPEENTSYIKTPEKVPPQVNKANETPIIKASDKAEKVNIEVYKNKKDQLTSELNGLLEKQREDTRRGDNEAKEKTKEEIRKISTQIYKLTDEVKERNKGTLPEGWWGK